MVLYRSPETNDQTFKKSKQSSDVKGNTFFLDKMTHLKLDLDIISKDVLISDKI